MAWERGLLAYGRMQAGGPYFQIMKSVFQVFFVTLGVRREDQVSNAGFGSRFLSAVQYAVVTLYVLYDSV